MGNGQKSKPVSAMWKGGEHRNIVFNLEIPSVGDMGLSVKLDAVCKKVDCLLGLIREQKIYCRKIHL